MPAIEREPHICTFVKYKKRSKAADKTTYFRCIDPDCTRVVDREFISGKRSRCNNCREPFILDKEALRRVKPLCMKCSNTKEGRLYRRSQLLINAILVNPNEPPQEEVKMEDPFGPF